jgi:hypothetical protein
MVCQEATEANPEKTEPNQEMMQSIGEHQEVPKEEAAVRSFRALKKQNGLESDCGAPPEAEGKDLGKLWIPEETDSHWQEADPLCKSGMVHKKHHQEKLDQGQG